jgi:hypothetical protein
VTDEIQRYDSDGNPVSLDTMVRREPEWAASRIRRMEADLASAEARGRLAGLREAEVLCRSRIAGFTAGDFEADRCARAIRKLIEEAGK